MTLEARPLHHAASRRCPPPRSGEDLESDLRALIETEGPIPLARFMAEANAAYYASRDPLGVGGDFITAPEISQMFGELIGLWLADLWLRAGKPPAACYVELGPGRGTLAEDALRAMRSAGLEPAVELVETSPVLRALQAERLPLARWQDDVASLPADGPLLAVANEFFDALPIRQFIRTDGGWRERLVDHDGKRCHPNEGDQPVDAHIPSTLVEAPRGAVFERSPAIAEVARALFARIAAQQGVAIVIDYGHRGPALGETLQAVSRHGYADPLEAPGTRDITAHVDFAALEAAACAAGLRVFGPVPQGEWLNALGIAARAAALAKSAPDRRDELAAARDRLTSPRHMGSLFKAMAFVSQGWPDPGGF